METTQTHAHRPTLAVAMIVKNEAANLRECLESIAGWTDEIVVLDAGSNDNTVDIAREFNARVFVNADWPGFGPQRQMAQSHVQSDWVLWLDADERVTPELRAEILAILQNPPTDTVFAIPRLSSAFGRFIHHSGWYPGYVLRLYPTALTGYDAALVHEKVIVPEHAKVQHLQSDLLHYTYEDIEDYLSKIPHYLVLWAQQQQQRGKRTSMLKAMGHGVACFIRMYFLKAGFLDGAQGFILATFSAYTTFAKYADLWVRTNSASPKP